MDEQWVTRTPDGGLQLGIADDGERDVLLLTADSLVVKPWLERRRSIYYADLLVHGCELIEEKQGLADWFSDVLTNPVLGLVGVFGVGRERQAVRLEVSDRSTGRPAVARIGAGGDLGERQAQLVGLLARTLARQPSWGAAVTRESMADDLTRWLNGDGPATELETCLREEAP